MTPRVLTAQHLNRALLVRQLLIGRVDRPVADALAQIGGLPINDPMSGPIGLWNRLHDLPRDALTDALEDRSVVQAVLMRSTPRLVDAREYWRFAAGVRAAARGVGSGVGGRARVEDAGSGDGSQRLRDALAEGPKRMAELDRLAGGGPGAAATASVDLVRVPPSPIGAEDGDDAFALADTWIGPGDATEADGLRHLVTAYLRGFGPAAWDDVATWAGLAASELREAAADMPLERYADEQGRELLDLPDEDLPDPELPAPTRFLVHGDETLLAHADRAGIVPPDLRARLSSSRPSGAAAVPGAAAVSDVAAVSGGAAAQGTAAVPGAGGVSGTSGLLLMGGVIVGTWDVADGEVRVDLRRALEPAEEDELEPERSGLEAFLAG